MEGNNSQRCCVPTMILKRFNVILYCTIRIHRQSNKQLWPRMPRLLRHVAELLLGCSSVPVASVEYLVVDRRVIGSFGKAWTNTRWSKGRLPRGGCKTDSQDRHDVQKGHGSTSKENLQKPCWRFQKTSTSKTSRLHSRKGHGAP